MPLFTCPEDRGAIDKALESLGLFDDKFNNAWAWLKKFSTDSAAWTGDLAAAVKGNVQTIADWYANNAHNVLQLDNILRRYGKWVDWADGEIKTLNTKYEELPDDAAKKAKYPDYKDYYDWVLGKLDKAARAARTSLDEFAWFYAPGGDGTAQTAKLFPPLQLPALPDLPLPKSVIPGAKDMPRVSPRLVRGNVDAGNKSDVRLLQAALRDRGWNIEVDGNFGPQTEAVIRQFQRNKGLSVTGKVGWTTWNALWTKKIVH